MPTHGRAIEVDFAKVHGLGNDFVAAMDMGDRSALESAAWSRLAQQLSARHTGVGCDGLLVIGPADDADLSMRVFNADGSRGQVCGNGMRCVAKLARLCLGVRREDIRIRTEQGQCIEVRASTGPDGGFVADVPMAVPSFGPAAVGTDMSHASAEGALGCSVALPTGHDLSLALVSMGNPHAIVFGTSVDTAAGLTLEQLGPMVEHHPAFPQRINLHLAHVSSSRIAVRSWERGCGITLACASGACAVLAAAVRLGLASRRAILALPGGSLDVSWANDLGPVVQRGPAMLVFTGRLCVAEDGTLLEGPPFASLSGAGERAHGGAKAAWPARR